MKNIERSSPIFYLEKKEIVVAVPNKAEIARLKASAVGRKGQVLNLIACGLSNDAIAKELEIKETTVKTYFDRLQVEFGTHSRINLAFKAIELDILNEDLLAQSLNLEAVSDLTEAEKTVLSALVLDQGEASSNKQIATTIGKSHHTVRSQLNRIFIKLGVGNKAGAGITYIAAKKRGLA